MNKTILLKERLQSNPFYEESTPENRHGSWKGRRIIGRDVEINKGVCLGGGSREAIVVDDIKQPELRKAYLKLIQNIELVGGDYKTEALNSVFLLVKEILPYKDSVVNSIYAQHGFVSDVEIDLQEYIVAKGGVCRHQALLCAYLLERLCKDRFLSGKVSVDRNFIEGQGGHAWARYTNSVGEVHILDVAQGYKGRLSEIKSNSHRWFYKRPGDKV